MARFLPLLKVLCVEQTVSGAKRDKGLPGILPIKMTVFLLMEKILR